MRAYLIDPEKRTIEQIEYSGDWNDIHKLIECEWFDAAQFDENGDVVYVDDEGLLHGNAVARHFFKISGYVQPLCGKGLILGTDLSNDGESRPPLYTLEQIKERVLFMTEAEAHAYAVANGL